MNDEIKTLEGGRYLRLPPPGPPPPILQGRDPPRRLHLVSVTPLNLARELEKGTVDTNCLKCGTLLIYPHVPKGDCIPDDSPNVTAAEEHWQKSDNNCSRLPPPAGKSLKLSEGGKF